MSKVLASLCNMPQSHTSGLVLADLATGESRLLDMGLPEIIKTCTGLAQWGGRVYAMGVTAEGVHYLTALASDTFAILFTCQLAGLRDAHSILADREALYVVSTGTDSVIRYDLLPDGLSNPVVAWQATSEGRDTHHVNSIALWNGDVVISAFGPKTGATWSTAAAGYIHNLTQNRRVAENIYQPHSLCASNGDLYYCESARGRIYSVSGGCLEVGGYLRGLAFSATGQFVVGTSAARKISKSSGIVNNPADPGEPSGTCTLAAYAVNAGKPLKQAELGLASLGSEIYDVLVLEWSESGNPVNESGLPGKISNLSPPGEDAHIELVQELSELRHQLGTITRERDEARHHHNQKEAGMAELEAQLQDARGKIAVQAGQLDHLAEQVKILAGELMLSRHRVEALHASTSWRATAPFRRLARWLRRK